MTSENIRRFSENIRKLREGKTLSQKDFAEFLGIKLSTYATWENGMSGPTHANLRNIAEKIGVSAESLLTEASNVRFIPQNTGLRRVPVVSYGECGLVRGSEYQDLCNQMDESVETDSKDPNAFAIHLIGDSMEPFASAGDTVVLNPNTPPRNGQPALVRLKTGETLFKWYFQRGESGEKIFLTSENREHAVLVRHADTIEWAYSVQKVIRQNQTRRLQDFLTQKQIDDPIDASKN